jgi:hypothetical protein
MTKQSADRPAEVFTSIAAAVAYPPMLGGKEFLVQGTVPPFQVDQSKRAPLPAGPRRKPPGKNPV